jgi:hypothetical protein
MRKLQSDLPVKAEVIADWFWDSAMRLRKTLITKDIQGARYAVRKVSAIQHDGVADEHQAQGNCLSRRAGCTIRFSCFCFASSLACCLDRTASL